jgi:hypothetical protein
MWLLAAGFNSISLVGTNLAKYSSQVTNGGCPTYDKDVAHHICPWQIR